MSAINYSGPDLPDLSTEDRRKHDGSPATTSKRRLNDSWFNRTRWPAFLVAWFVLGLAVFGLIYHLLGR